MKLKTLAAACVLFLLTISAGAQERGKDPISGSWGSDGQPLLELQYDGKSTLTGTTIWRRNGRELSRGPIKKGTFDSKTDVFHLEGDAKSPDDGATHRFVIQGRIDNDTATGTYEFAGQKGDFTFKKIS
jgi:hypothetical protein